MCLYFPDTPRAIVCTKNFRNEPILYPSTKLHGVKTKKTRSLSIVRGYVVINVWKEVWVLARQGNCIIYRGFRKGPAIILQRVSKTNELSTPLAGEKLHFLVQLYVRIRSIYLYCLFNYGAVSIRLYFVTH